MRRILTTFLTALFPLLLVGQNIEFSKPRFSGLLRTGFEADLTEKDSRFYLMHARVGVAGEVSGIAKYRLQYELSNYGTSQLLDAFGGIDICKNLVVWGGQMSLPFTEDYMIGPAQNIFSQLDYLSYKVGPGARDVGAMVDYTLETKVTPILFQVGAFNGNGINNATWDDNPFYAARITVGRLKGFRGSVKYFGGKNENGFRAIGRIDYYGVDLRYASDALEINAAWNERKIEDIDDNLGGMFLQAAYKLPITFKETSKLQYIRPAARWDAMGYDFFSNGFDVDRATIGVNFGFNVKKLVTEFRINYENVFLRDDELTRQMYFANDPRGASDKLIFELFVKF